MRLFFIFVLLFPAIVSAKNTTIFKCEFKQGKTEMAISLDAIGKGEITLKKNKKKCALDMGYIEDLRKDRVPSFHLQLKKGVCTESKNLEKVINDVVYLRVAAGNAKKRESEVQWHRALQPNKCRVSEYREKDLALAAKKWKKGLWGRSKGSKSAK